MSCQQNRIGTNNFSERCALRFALHQRAVWLAAKSLIFLKRLAATCPFNRGMEVIGNAIAGITPGAWIAIALLAAVVVAGLVAVGIAWLLAYAD